MLMIAFVIRITDDELWFVHSGNDLKIDLMGTNTQVTVANWFGSGNHPLQEITAGGLKLDDQISQLVQAIGGNSTMGARALINRSLLARGPGMHTDCRRRLPLRRSPPVGRSYAVDGRRFIDHPR
jgi:hypothetical protein